MKLIACLFILLQPIQTCFTQKNATLHIKSNQNSLSLINRIHIHQDERNLSTWLFDIKNIFIRDLDSGHYTIHYITYFMDTLSEELYIHDHDKIKIEYPHKNFYQETVVPDTLIEDFLSNDQAVLKLYIKSNIYDHTFYHQVLLIRKNLNAFEGYYSSHNYGPDRSEGLNDTTAYLDLSGKHMKGIIEFLYLNQASTNPNTFVNCSHFSEVYLLNKKKYFYFNICEDELEKTFNLVSEF